MMAIVVRARRWGIAALCGVTLLGALSILGEDAASAATAAHSIYGQTADATTAAEFESLGCTRGQSKVAVLATDADPYDVLAAATLEGALNNSSIANHGRVGVLITEPTQIDTNTAQAIALEGVGTIYVVGGPLAVSAADVTTLQTMSATSCGGVATASKINVVGPIFGATADDTAVAIDTFAQGVSPQSAALHLPSQTATTSTTYNDTAQIGSAAGLGANNSTAIVTADTDFQDPAAAAGIAYKYQLPVMLTPGSSLGSQAAGELAALHITQVLLIGGQLALQTAVVNSITALGIKVIPIAGIDYTDSAAELAKFETSHIANTGLGWTSTTLLLTQGAHVNDALGAAALSAGPGASLATTAPLILTTSPIAGLSTADTTVLGILGKTISTIQPLGGPLALPAATITAALTALA
jgi:hypothetical protein